MITTEKLLHDGEVAFTSKYSHQYLLKVLFAKGLMNANMGFLKSARLSEFLILESKLVLSLIADGKKQFLK